MSRIQGRSTGKIDDRPGEGSARVYDARNWEHFAEWELGNHLFGCGNENVPEFRIDVGMNSRINVQHGGAGDGCMPLKVMSSLAT